MGYYLLVILIPAFIVVLASKWVFPHKITLKEWLAQFGVLLLSTALCLGLAVGSNMFTTYDTEILNGYVTKKESVRVACEHQYKCGETCSTDSKGNMSCIPIYCDEHAYDVDWNVHTTVGDLTIDRVDRRGLREPDRFSRVAIGEFAASTHGTTNYLLLDKSKFDTDESIVQKYEGKVPKYPQPFDYYRLNRVINTTQSSFNYINVFLNNELRSMGAKKELNVIVVITQYDADFFKALIKQWNGGKKNDVILVYGIDNTNNIRWFNSTSFADGQDNRELHSRLRIETHDKKISLQLVSSQLKLTDQYFKRLPNETFSYMDAATNVPLYLIIFAAIFNAIIALAFTYFVYKEDLF